MQIRLRYKVEDQANWISFPITLEEYFEEPEAASAYQWDDVPRHLHAVYYLPVPEASVSSTEIRIWQPDDTLRLTITEILWNAGRNVIIQRFQDDFDLLIIQVLVGGPPATWHTIRFSREADMSQLLEHLQTVETPTGQALGPSEVLSLPAGEGSLDRSPPHSRQEILWNNGNNSIVYDGDVFHTFLDLKLQILNDPSIVHTIMLLRGEEGAGLLEHYESTNGVQRTIVRRQL